MDKKLIVDIDNIEIKSKKSKVKNSYDDMKKNIDLLPKVLKIFQRIHVETLKIDGNEFTVELNEEALYLDNKFINISSKVDFLANQVVFDMYSLYLKDVKLMVDGKIKVDYFNNKIDHFGKYYYHDLQGEVKLEMTEKEASFYLNSESFKSLKFLKKFFRLSKVAESWMYDNVKGDLKLNEFYGKVDLVKNQLIEDSLSGNATINNAKIKFHKDLKAIDTKKVDVFFEKDKLSFILDKPKYHNVNIAGSKVVINNLTSQKKGEVVVDIKAVSKLDKRVLEILKAFNINLPLVQKSGSTKASLTLKIPYMISKPMSTKGKFLVSKANIDINGFLFYSKKAAVILDGTIVKVKNAHFKHKKMIDANVNIDIDTKTLTASGDALINSFLIESKNGKIVHIKNKKTPLFLSFNDPVEIILDGINTDITISDLIYVNILNLRKIYKYSKLLKDISIKDGNLSLIIKDENNITFDGFVSGLDYPIAKNGKKITSLNIKGKIKDSRTTVSSKNKDIKIDIKNNNLFIDLKNLTLLINSEAQSESNISKLDVRGQNIKLQIDKKMYHLETASAKIRKNEVVFDGKILNLDLPIKKENKAVKRLNVEGSIKDGLILINTKDNTIKLKISYTNKMDISLDGYDIYVNSEDNRSDDELNNISIKAKNSNIFLNEKYKFLADTYEIRIRENSSFFHLNHKKSDITYKKSKDGKIDIFANEISDEFVNTIFDKKILNDGKLMLLANGISNDLKGKLLLTNVNIDDLAILNNLLLFVHSSPALINPFLAVPSVVGLASNKGFNLTGYKVIDGVAEFTYKKDKSILDINKLVTIGNGIDFEGNGSINLNDLTLDSKVKMIFFKDYTTLVGAIPVVNYVLLGKNKRVATKVNIFGPLNNPKLSTNLTKDAFSVPLNIAKRILTSPVKLFEFIKDNEKNKPKDKK